MDLRFRSTSWFLETGRREKSYNGQTIKKNEKKTITNQTPETDRASLLHRDDLIPEGPGGVSLLMLTPAGHVTASQAACSLCCCLLMDSQSITRSVLFY